MEVREPAVAGSFYPEDKTELKKTIEKYIDDVPKTNDQRPKAVIVPHAGYVYSGQVAANAYALVFEFKKVVVIGPSHYMEFTGVCTDDSRYWETPLGQVKISKADNMDAIHNAHINEHSIEVHVPFLQMRLKEFTLTPILTGDVEPRDVAELISDMPDRDTLLVVSSDLSHYLPYDEAKIVDSATIDAIMKLDIEKFMMVGDACGKTGIASLIVLAKKLKWKPKLLKYANSGDVTKDKKGVVGYASIAFY